MCREVLVAVGHHSNDSLPCLMRRHLSDRINGAHLRIVGKPLQRIGCIVGRAHRLQLHGESLSEGECFLQLDAAQDIHVDDIEIDFSVLLADILESQQRRLAAPRQQTGGGGVIVQRIYALGAWEGITGLATFTVSTTCTQQHKVVVIRITVHRVVLPHMGIGGVHTEDDHSVTRQGLIPL